MTGADPSSYTGRCRDCGEPFTLSPGAVAFYGDRGLTLPARCRPCRDRRRAARLEVSDVPSVHER
jgi:hypothetical protein